MHSKSFASHFIVYNFFFSSLSCLFRAYHFLGLRFDIVVKFVKCICHHKGKELLFAASILTQFKCSLPEEFFFFMISCFCCCLLCFYFFVLLIDFLLRHHFSSSVKYTYIVANEILKRKREALLSVKDNQRKKISDSTITICLLVAFLFQNRLLKLLLKLFLEFGSRSILARFLFSFDILLCLLLLFISAFLFINI